MKQCPECKKLGEGLKPLSEFNRSAKARDGLQSWCRACMKKRHFANAAEMNARNKRWREAHPEKMLEFGRRWRNRNPLKVTAKFLKAAYGVSPEQYSALFDAQRGLCAVCGVATTSQLVTVRSAERKTVAHVDHCHETKAVRGLLCSHCNVGLGYFKDDEKYLLRAARYLRASATESVLGRAQRVKLQGESEPENRDLNRTVRRVSRREELSPF